jgi:hypothetical protein
MMDRMILSAGRLGKGTAESSKRENDDQYQYVHRFAPSLAFAALTVAVPMPEQMQQGANQQKQIRRGGQCVPGVVPEQIRAKRCNRQHHS